MSQVRSIHIIGAGGHAKVVIRAAELQGYQVIGVFDDDTSKYGTVIADATVVGTSDDLLNQPRYPTVAAVGDNATRKRIVGRLDLDWISIIHPGAIVDQSVELGRGSVVMAGAVIQVDTEIKNHVIVNTGSTIDHDCSLDDFCHVAPGSHLAGHCWLAEGVLLGIGAVAIPSVKIGAWATVGAGAAVINDIDAQCVALGVPARTRRSR